MTIVGWIIFVFISCYITISIAKFFKNINEKQDSLFKKRNSNREGRTSRRIKNEKNN